MTNDRTTERTNDRDYGLIIIGLVSNNRKRKRGKQRQINRGAWKPGKGVRGSARVKEKNYNERVTHDVNRYNQITQEKRTPDSRRIRQLEPSTGMGNCISLSFITFHFTTGAGGGVRRGEKQGKWRGGETRTNGS